VNFHDSEASVWLGQSTPRFDRAGYTSTIVSRALAAVGATRAMRPYLPLCLVGLVLDDPFERVFAAITDLTLRLGEWCSTT
jgi:hypothetical protein